MRGTTSQPVIAERQLVRSGSDVPVTIRIYAPEPMPRESDATAPWRCAFEILGDDDLAKAVWRTPLAEGEVYFVRGVDSIDVLQQTFIALRGLLDSAAHNLGCELSWPSTWPGNGYGIAYQIQSFHGAAGERRLIEAVERETRKMFDEGAPGMRDWFRQDVERMTPEQRARIREWLRDNPSPDAKPDERDEPGEK
jgi:hypothetical protein